MELPFTLQKKIVDFLTSLPNINDNNSQRVLIYQAGLDSQLQDQIPFGTPPAQFVPLLVSTLIKYGNLKDGRNALEAVLETAKICVGQDRKAYCEILIQELRAIAKGPSQVFPKQADISRPTKKILILSANPKDTARLRLDVEVREIEEGLRRSKHREQFTIQSKWAVRLRDLRRAMLDEEPQIVHFCGHGEEDGLMVEDENGNAILVDPDALAGLFELFKNQVECVLLNACYSQLQAEAINKHINYVIGMSKGIQDTTAIEFAVGFYDALGAGKLVEEAFKFGCNAIQLQNIPEHLTPILKKRLNNQTKPEQEIQQQEERFLDAAMPKQKVEIPKVPDDIQALFDEGWALRDLGRDEEARIVFQKSLERAISSGHNLAIARAKCYIAGILIDWDKNPTAAKVLLQECLQEFKSANLEKDVAIALYQLGIIEIYVGNLDQAEAYLSQSLELDSKNRMKLHIAWDLHQLGWVEEHRGHLKQALELYAQALNHFLGVYQEQNTETEKRAIHGVAACYQHKGLVYRHKGKVEETESNFMRALDWYRRSDLKPEIGKMLYLLAELKYREAQYDAGTQFLDEAMQIYNEIGDYSYYARCLDLKGRLHFTLGQTDEATAIFESALNAVEKSGDYKEQEDYLNKLGHVYLEARKLEQAKGYFGRARDLSLREGLLDGYAASIKNLAQIAHIEGNHDGRNRLLSDGIQTLEKLLLSVQAEPRRAFITGEIGFFYERMENFQQAVIYYQRAKKAFESLSDIGGIANCLGSIARVKGLLGKKNEEFDIYRELKKLVDGSPYYDLIAGTAINLGEIQMQIGDLDEAKMLFQEAEFLCQKYNLHYLPHVRDSIRRLQEQINLRKPPELNFKQLIEELFELVNWFPEAKDSIFRLWMWGRKEALLGNYRNTAGIKFMLCQDDVDTFLRTSKVLHLYSDLCLQVVSSEYPGTSIDTIPFPKDKKIFFDCGIPYKEEIGDGVYTVGFLSGGIHSRYQLTAATTVRSKVTGNEGVTITGWSLGFPDQAHQLILSSSATDLTGQKIFFLPYERHLANDKLLSDLRLSKELGLVPVYFDSLPNSDSVEIMTSMTVDLPALLPDDVEHQRKQIRKVKHSLFQLLSVTKESAQSSLNNLIFEVDELSDICVSEQSIEIQIYILDFPGLLQREFYIAWVIIDYQTNPKE